MRKTLNEDRNNSARGEALDAQLFTLDDSHFDAFAADLKNPPAPGPKLQALLRRKPAWRTWVLR